jgi:hypothetical protein
MNKKTFPIVNDAACLYKWSWSTLFLNRGTTASCHRGHHWKLDKTTLKDFHNHPGKIGDREKMLEGVWPGNGCEYCRNVEQAGGTSDRTGFANDSVELLPYELELNPKATSVTPTFVEVYFSNVCNQSCVYCSPGFSSQIEQEVRRYGKSEFNYDYSNFAADDRDNYTDYVNQFWEWMHENSTNLVILNTLGGEPMYQKEFEQHLEFFETHYNPNLIWRIFSNLKHDTAKFKEKIDRVQKLVDDGRIKRLEITASIDCWGPQLEYARYGLELENCEANINTVLSSPGVTLQLHATMTPVTLTSFYELLDKICGDWIIKKPSVNMNWNTVVRPDCFNVYNFGKYLVPYIDKAIETLLSYDEYKYAKEVDSLNGIKKQMLNTPVNLTGVNNLVGFLDDLDARRNLDWKKIYPDIVEIIDTINKENTNV